jgi:hypothetical protein
MFFLPRCVFSPTFLGACGIFLLSGCAGQVGLPFGGGSTNPPNTLAPENTPADRRSPGQLQLEVMDFSDFFVASTGATLESILAMEKDPLRRVAILTWKVRYTTAAMEIGSGADPRTSLLDMAIFITAGRWALERYWIPEIFGPEGRRLQPVYAQLENRIWELVGQRLLPEQTALLQNLVQQWTKENPPSFEIYGLRFRNLEGVQASDFRPPHNAQGLLAAVRNWLGEVNTSLLFGERILFYLERTPRVLAQQTDLTLAQIAETFPLIDRLCGRAALSTAGGSGRIVEFAGRNAATAGRLAGAGNAERNSIFGGKLHPSRFEYDRLGQRFRIFKQGTPSDDHAGAATRGTAESRSTRSDTMGTPTQRVDDRHCQPRKNRAGGAGIAGHRCAGNHRRRPIAAGKRRPCKCSHRPDFPSLGHFSGTGFCSWLRLDFAIEVRKTKNPYLFRKRFFATFSG